MIQLSTYEYNIVMHTFFLQLSLRYTLFFQQFLKLFCHRKEPYKEILNFKHLHVSRVLYSGLSLILLLS